MKRMLHASFVRLVTVAALAMSVGVGCSEAPRPTFRGEDAGGCTRTADCDDNIPCTVDVCAVGGTCEHIADNARCPMGQMCSLTRGCGTGTTARTCRATADCNDNVPCTRDTCTVEMTCRNTPQNEMCPSGQTCDPERGCTSGMVMPPPGTCRSSADCNDRQDCTEDTCNVMGMCVFVPQNARCGAGRVCRAGMGCVMERACSTNRDCDDGMRCNGAETCSELACVGGTAPNCDDGDACTVDACSNTGTEMCTHMRDPSCMTSMIRSGFYNVSPAVMYRCTDKIFGMDVVNFNITAFQFVVSATGLTVNGAPTAMTGSAPTGRMFRATGTVAGTCREVYTLEGMFTDATHFTATFTVDFQGVDCFLSNCTRQMRTVMGTARM